MAWWIWLVIAIVILLIIGLFFWSLFWIPKNGVVRNAERIKIRLRLDQSNETLIKSLITLVNQVTGKSLIDPGSVDIIEQVKFVPIQLCYLDDTWLNSHNSNNGSNIAAESGGGITETRSDRSMSNSASSASTQGTIRHLYNNYSSIRQNPDTYDEETGEPLTPIEDLTGEFSRRERRVEFEEGELEEEESKERGLRDGESEGETIIGTRRFKYALSILDLLDITKAPPYQNQEWRTDQDGNLIFRIQINSPKWSEFHLVFIDDPSSNLSNNLDSIFRLVQEVKPKMIPIKLVKIHRPYVFYTLMVGELIFSVNLKQIIQGILNKRVDDWSSFLVKLDQYVPHSDDVHIDLGIVQG